MSPALLFALVGCDPDNELNSAEPDGVAEPATVDFGEVVAGHFGEIGAVIRNEGLGTLRIEGAELESGSSGDFELVSWPETLSAHAEGLLVVRYTPEAEGEDWGTVNLATNQKDRAVLPVTLTGLGVRPCIDIDPELLWFGTVAPGDSVTKSFDVRAGCTGTLVLSSALFPGNEADAYTLSLPEDWAEPYSLRTGFSFTAGVTFAPPDTNEWSGALWFKSNDPDDATSAVTLRGNTVDDPTENVAPSVEILDPNVGEYFLDNQLVTLTASVVDEDEPVTNLVCSWSANGTRLASADATPSAEGTIAGATELPVGDVDVTLRCFDSEGAVGEDSVRVLIWKNEEPLQYIISGGSTEFDYFSIDDDISFHLNGTAFFTDNNDTKDNLAPVHFDAKVGDTLRIVAVDQNSTEGLVEALVLHWGTGKTQELNSKICVSSDPAHDCFDGTYAGPWPSDLLDEAWVIAIP